jgi:outer membrane translocation and assembly module TamA
VIAKSRIGVPDPLLFRAGGDDSVRGYGYRPSARTSTAQSPAAAC